MLKKKLDASKGTHVDELPQVLWTIHTTSRTATEETIFSIAYGIEAMSLVEVRLHLHCCLYFKEISNDELRMCKLDYLEEK